MKDGRWLLEYEAMRGVFGEPTANGDDIGRVGESLALLHERTDALEDTFIACTHACACVLKNMEEEICALCAQIAPRDVGFANKAGVFGSVCDWLVRMEALVDELGRVLYPCYSAQAQINACTEILLGVKATLASSCEEEETAQAEARLLKLGTDFLAFRSRALAFLSEQLATVMSEVQRCADFAHRGEGCDTHSLLRLCDTLLFAMRQVGRE